MNPPNDPRRYTYPVHLLIAPFLRVVLGIPSPPSRDAARLLRGAHPTPRVLTPENIPLESPIVLTFNHYDHPKLGAWWGTGVIMVTVAARRTREPREIHFAMAREWWYPGGIGRIVKQPLTNWFFGRLAKTYGFIRLPPVLGREEFRGQGALAVRHALSLTRGASPQLVALSPEGRTGEGLALREPPMGAGLFVLMLTHEVIPVLPVGIYEDEGMVLTVKFGVPYFLSVPRKLPRPERDREAARQIMIEMGKQLPERMRGAYREDIAATMPVSF